ncbi:sensor histidine kinase [Streptomyces sp. Ncost-T10-10d]|uniref:sensor histidine kinase n=1 Tax=Streptomyces sp. Ncost-T10-10d TaxID=1839774 RepID=UPI00081DE9D8|nr:sensor histidine kinase [Streptomyces sp. Ncost-T10-10d]SCF83780.1 Signal transduction histidine kinase [Streptomyces sp. Ncost-T10-10d]
MTARRPMSWAGPVLYPAVVVVLVGGAPRAPVALRALGVLLAAVLLVGLARRRSGAALALTLTGATTVAVFSDDRGPGRFLAFLAADVVLGRMVATGTRRPSVLAIAVSAVLQFTAIGALTQGPDDLILTGAIALLAITTCCAAGLLARERREHAAALRGREVAEAVTAERLRIARELHDVVAHSIGIIAIQAGVGARVIETQPTEAREALRVVESTSRETLASLRRTLIALREADSETASGRAQAPAPGLAELDRLVATSAEAGIRVDVHRTGEPRPLPADVDLAAYRIVQEAVTNVVRHAGTRECRVAIDYAKEGLSVEIVDDGQGPATDGRADRSGFGITGMRERVNLLHGRFSAGPRPERGFQVTATLPLTESAGAEAR